MGDSAEAKQRLFQKDRQFTPEQQLWVERFIETARRAELGRTLIPQRIEPRVFMNYVRDILLHLKTPRNTMATLGGGKIPVAGGKTAVTKPPLDHEGVMQCLKYLMYDTKAFRADNGLVVKMRKFLAYCGADRQALTHVLHAPPPNPF